MAGTILLRAESRLKNGRVSAELKILGGDSQEKEVSNPPSREDGDQES